MQCLLLLCLEGQSSPQVSSGMQWPEASLDQLKEEVQRTLDMTLKGQDHLVLDKNINGKKFAERTYWNTQLPGVCSNKESISSQDL